MRAPRPRRQRRQRFLQAYLDGLESEFVERFQQIIQNQLTESDDVIESLRSIRELYDRWLRSRLREAEQWYGENNTSETYGTYSGQFQFTLRNDTSEDEDEIQHIEEQKEISSKHINRPDKRSWLTLPVGLEYTFHYINKRRPRFTMAEDRLVDKLTKALPQTSESIVYLDSHCIEIGTPVHRTWKQCSKYYRQLIKHAKRHRLTVTARKSGGGGCHINVSIPKNRSNQPDHRFVLKLLCDLVNRPYINWIFNEPSDNHTANCYVLRLAKLLKERKPTDTDEAFWPSVRSYFDDRGMSIRIKDSNHFELRCFDMVRNERDLKDVLMFVSRYLKMIKSQKKITKCVWDLTNFDSDNEELHPIINVSKSEVLTEFKELLVKLNLDYKDYRRFVERNLNKRFSKTYGEKYLR